MLKAQNQTIKITTKENRSDVKHQCHCTYHRLSLDEHIKGSMMIAINVVKKSTKIDDVARIPAAMIRSAVSVASILVLFFRSA